MKRILILILVVAIISTIPFTFISCNRTSEYDLFWQMLETYLDDHPQNAKVMSLFSNKEYVEMVDYMDWLGIALFKEVYEEDAQEKIKYTIFDLQSEQVKYEKTVGLTENYELNFDDNVIVEKTVLDLNTSYNYYAPNMQLMRSSETPLTVSTDYANVTIEDQSYRINLDGSLTPATLNTVTYKKGDFNCYATSKEIVVKNNKSKIIYSEKLNNKVQVFNYLDNMLIRQEIIELPTTEKKYTYIENGKKYKVEQTLITLKKNKAKESEIKDVKYLITNVDVFMDGDTIYERLTTPLYSKVFKKMTNVTFREIVNKNLLAESSGIFNKEFEREFESFTGNENMHVSGDNVVVERNSKCYIYDKQGNLKHDLSEYTVDIEQDILIINNKVYDYNLNEILVIDDNKQRETMFNNSFVYTTENEKLQETDPDTISIFAYDYKAKTIKKKFDQAVEYEPDVVVTINSDGTYLYNLINHQTLDVINVSDSIKTILTVTEDEFNARAIFMYSRWCYLPNGKAAVLYRVYKEYGGEVTTNYIMLK